MSSYSLLFLFTFRYCGCVVLSLLSNKFALELCFNVSTIVTRDPVYRTVYIACLTEMSRYDASSGGQMISTSISRSAFSQRFKSRWHHFLTLNKLLTCNSLIGNLITAQSYESKPPILKLTIFCWLEQILRSLILL